jgi:DNA mismatch repair protein MutH
MTHQPSLFVSPSTGPRLTREAALERLRDLLGRDLRALGRAYGVTFEREGARNKGWAGQVVERCLGLAADGQQLPDFGDWELKVVPLVERKDGVLVPRETMAITMFTAADLERDFEASHLYDKLRRLVVVARIYEGPDEARSLVYDARAFDLDAPGLLAAVAADYDEIRWVARNEGLAALTGRVGRLVQPRPKGDGRLADGHAFYARKGFVARMLGLEGADTAYDEDESV